jgi:hypothetical protein
MNSIKRPVDIIEEDSWDEEEAATWKRIEENRRTCLMRRTCVIAVLVVYAFLILNWRLGGVEVTGSF